MNELFTPLLTLILNNGYPIIVGVIFTGALGAPLPATATLLVAGSLSANGSLNFLTLVILTTLSAIFGDVIAYLFAQRLAEKLNISKGVLAVDSFLRKWGFWSIFLTRFLLTPLGVPVSLAAGMSNYPFKRFFLTALLGELLWTSGYLYLGNLFGANWVALLDYLISAPSFLALFVIGVGAFIIALNTYRKH